MRLLLNRLLWVRLLLDGLLWVRLLLRVRLLVLRLLLRVREVGVRCAGVLGIRTRRGLAGVVGLRPVPVGGVRLLRCVRVGGAAARFGGNLSAVVVLVGRVRVRARGIGVLGPGVVVGRGAVEAWVVRGALGGR
ncbi:hypothetical protein, partial [Streptomyces decoyicus]|uniref:hypothetical protein n=1 Tax=Streptomyces decoyicus TaxID=249567 RepID=UPI0006C38E13